MNVDVTINVRYTKVTPVGPYKSVSDAVNIEIKDNIDELLVAKYIETMTPTLSPAP